MTALKIGAGALGLSGVLHFVGVLMGGFAPGAGALIAVGAVYLLLAWALAKTGARALAWLVFVMMLVMPVLAIGASGPKSPMPDAITWVIVALDYLCAACLFVTLWRSKRT